MAKMKDLAMIHGAAFYFANISRDKKRIAEHFGVSVRTIERWSKEPEWEQALNAWGYTGERSFTPPPRRDIANESREHYEKARAMYIQFLRDGEPEHKLATITADAINANNENNEKKLLPSTIRRWATKHRWREYYRESNISNRETKTFTGASGTPYEFESYLLWTEFPGIGVVYIFTKRYPSSGKIIHEPLYIGQTQSLAGKFYDHHKFDCVMKQGGNIICIHRENNESLRRKKESDLIAALNPICNKREVNNTT